MGQLSLIAVVAAFLISGILLYNANSSAMRSDEKVWEHQSHVLARDASTTGMAVSVRLLSEHLNTDWSLQTAELNAMTDESYNGGTYTVEAFSNQCSILNNTSQTKLINRYWPAGFSGSRDLMEVRATGTVHAISQNDAEQGHQIIACYLQADYNDPTPPSYQFAFISNDDFEFRGGPDILAYLEGEGNVHSNEAMDLWPQVVIDGHATMTDTVNSSNSSDNVSSFGYGPTIPMVQFDPEEFRTDNGIPSEGPDESNEAYMYTSGSLEISGDVTLSPPSGGDREDDPWIWFVDGDLTIRGNAHLNLPQWTTIVTTGKLEVQGGANVTVTGDTPQDYCDCNKPSDEEMRDWVGTQLLGGEHSPLAWYIDGDGPGGEMDVNIGGGGAMIGNIYTNGDFLLDGGGGGMNLVGNIAAYGTIRANGGGNGNNFWFLEVGQQNIIDGVLLPGKQVVRLALAEWTDPVLDN